MSASPVAQPRGSHLRTGDPRAGGDSQPAGGNQFRAAMRHHAKGVAVITAGTHAPTGFCATSLASVSLEPPLVSFAIGTRTASWTTVATARYVVAHLLADSQADLARRFGRPGADKFGPRTRWHRGAFGLPMLDDVLAWMVLAPVSRQPVGDHSLVVGRVVLSGHNSGRGPLIHHDGSFARLAAPLSRDAACG